MNTEDEDRDHQESRISGEVAPGAPIVRSSTPRPLSFGLFEPNTSQSQATQQPGHETTSVFPIEAPSAPPLPEECGESEQGGEETPGALEATPLPGRSEPAEELPGEFFWLFEYGLEMDSAILNSSKRLDGLALLYGPAVLKGYELTFDVISSRGGPGVASILPSRKREAEVWGILYRVPHRLTAQLDNEPALLDRIHSAAPPDGLFERLSVTVHEAYRGREITCITYIASATARNQFHLLPRERQIIDPIYAQRLLETARKQKLPGDYLHELRGLIAPHESLQPAVPVAPVAPVAAVEQNTEPLPVFFDERRTLAAAPGVRKAPSQPRNTGMVIFALYLVCSLLAVFTFAILQGLGVASNLFAGGFAPLDIPWFVLVYGLIGGCLSCIVSLGRHHPTNLPNFVLITWFTRPLIGSVLAVLAYLLLNSGLFVLNANVEQHHTLYSLLAVLAGACEGWLFSRRA
ncbi:MAG: gamma-glutamylcyclotransferase [Ktedonobacteraceae bacterium]